MKCRLFFLIVWVCFALSCAKESPYLSGHIRRVHDAVMTTCDPYNKGLLHSCVVFSSAFKNSLYVYDATAAEMVLSPMGYLPLKIKVGNVTDTLSVVVSDDKKFPYLVAVDKSLPGLYVVNLFPDELTHEKSFSEPRKFILQEAPFDMAAFKVNDHVFSIMTFPEQGRIDLGILDNKTGEPNSSIKKSIMVGSKPSRVVVDPKRKKALIADKDSASLHVLDLSNIDAVVHAGAAHVINTIPIGFAANGIFLAYRDFGSGERLYALVVKTLYKDVVMLDVDNTIKATLTPSEDIVAAYLPDNHSDACCKGQKQWFSLASIKGQLTYYAVKASAGALTVEQLSTVDLTSENNLALNTLHLQKIIGGALEQDAKIEREKLCQSNRQTFYIASYGNRRSFSDYEPIEIEAHGFSCEGEEAASRFGIKNK